MTPKNPSLHSSAFTVDTTSTC